MNGHLELKFTEDKTQVLAHIFPPRAGGKGVTAQEVVERLKGMGVQYGIREAEIREAVHRAEFEGEPLPNVVVAQGVVPHNGADAKVKFHLPEALLAEPLPRRADGSGLPDWFRLNPGKVVAAETELASILPPQPGTPGKTLTHPVAVVPGRPGRPADLGAGDGVHASTDGTRLFASKEGYAVLHADTLTVHPLRLVTTPILGGSHCFPDGVVFQEGLKGAQVRAGEFIAVRKVAVGCRLRAIGDVFLRYAEDCEIVAGGTVYVTQGLKNCRVNARGRLIALEAATFTGGELCATEGICACTVGAEDFPETRLTVGIDRHAAVRAVELDAEQAECEAGIQRLALALKPFGSVAVHAHLPEDKKLLLSRLQSQQRSLEAHIKDLHHERRALLIAAKEAVHAEVSVTQTAHPNVWIEIHSAAYLVESPMHGVTFAEAPGGKSLIFHPAPARAA